MAFSSVVGHAPLTALLSQAIARQTLPPTQLYTGPSGAGKVHVARAVAAALNCLAPITTDRFPHDACGVCRACERVARNVHVDVLIVEPDDRASIKIDVVRDVLARSGYRPFEGRHRLVVLRDADTLEIPAQNALLKSLEEPPPSTTFILTTAVPGALLPTVLSRCMRLRFGRLLDSAVATILVRDHGFSADDARATALLAGGSVAQALALGSTDVAVSREIALQLLQQTSTQTAMASRLQTATLLSTGTSRKERSRNELGVIIRIAASLLRDIELLNAGGDWAAMANPAQRDDVQRLAPAFTGARAREAFAAAGAALSALDRNAGIKVVSEWLSVRL